MEAPDRAQWASTVAVTSGGKGWYKNGAYSLHRDHELDVVAEWAETMPIRTVTRQEIVPGTYGILKVDMLDDKRPTVAFWHGTGPLAYTADELDRAASVLTALAGALRDGQ